MTVRITWDQASAQRLERQFLATPAEEGTPPADLVAAMLAAHAQVLSAAEVSVGVRGTGTTRADVRAALWEDRSLVKTHGPRGQVDDLQAGGLCGGAFAVGVAAAARFLRQGSEEVLDELEHAAGADVLG